MRNTENLKYIFIYLFFALKTGSVSKQPHAVKKVLSERVASKAVVCQNTSQVRVVGEEHAEHVPYFTLEPVGTFEHTSNGVNGSQLVCVGLYTDAVVVAQGKKDVDEFEAVLP
ncbi:hypothetical protein BpHYR1_020781 [Brachionus plicatilis]|uniref:Uncharacterized protein n=1 Tax=Brachionus plicatilis TaxID=10195 RepID=A0A3M7P7C6_BRAPC|nr:hypothetical protein BpHYR1_020781 [Brachionus plicatilis]